MDYMQKNMKGGGLGQICHSRSKLEKQMRKDDIFPVNDNYQEALI